MTTDTEQRTIPMTLTLILATPTGRELGREALDFNLNIPPNTAAEGHGIAELPCTLRGHPIGTLPVQVPLDRIHEHRTTFSLEQTLTIGPSTVEEIELVRGPDGATATKRTYPTLGSPR